MDIPWTTWHPELATEGAGADQTGFDKKRGEFRVVDDWCEAQFLFRGNPNFTDGSGTWIMNLPLWGEVEIISSEPWMDFKIYGHGALGYSGSPVHQLSMYVAADGVGDGVSGGQAKFVYIVVDGTIFVSDGLPGTHQNLHAQLAYRIHPDYLYGDTVEDEVLDQHGIVLP